MSEYLNETHAQKAEWEMCTCAAKKFRGTKTASQVEHALSCPANILYRSKKKIGRLIRKNAR